MTVTSGKIAAFLEKNYRRSGSRLRYFGHLFRVAKPLTCLPLRSDKRTNANSHVDSTLDSLWVSQF